MNKQTMHRIFKNKDGLVRSGWIILAAMIIFYGVGYLISFAYIAVLEYIFFHTGDINKVTRELSPLVNWMNAVALPLINQFVADAVMIAVPVVLWKCFMKNPVKKLGIQLSAAGRRNAAAGFVLGAVNCSIVFILVLAFGNGHVVSLSPNFSLLTFWWILAFIVVAFAEEIMNRGFFMAVLRRCRNLYIIMLLPSVIFGLIHLMNPGVTFFSVCNIVLVGILFSYMFIKSGNIWMCIGYHFSWNTFQGVLYGMPVSGLTIPGIFHTEYTSGNVLNGGSFGIEGGILTTLITLLSFILVWYYYRNSAYDFLEDTYKTSSGPI